MTASERIALCLQHAFSAGGVPRLLQPADFSESALDKRALLTYLAVFKGCVERTVRTHTHTHTHTHTEWERE